MLITRALPIVIGPCARMHKRIAVFGIDDSPMATAGLENGRYWARTSDPQLVELVLSQLS